MAQKNFNVHINLNNQQLLNATLQNLAIHPSTANLTEGFIYWNTADDTAYCYTGNSTNPWLDLGDGGEVNLSILHNGTSAIVSNDNGTGFTINAVNKVDNTAGLMLPSDKTKLDGIESGANNYVHPTENPGTHPFSSEITSGLLVLSQLVVNNLGHTVAVKGRNLTAADIASVMINNAINNGTVTTWSSQKIYNEIQNAINQAQTGALQYKGEYNATTNTPVITADPTIKVGYTYVVVGSGVFAGQEVEAGDMIIAKTDNPANINSNWQIVNKNIPAIVSATQLVEGITRYATNQEAIAGTLTNVAISPATLRAVLDSTVGGYSVNFGNGTSTSFTITHGLNTQDVILTVVKVSDRSEVVVDARASSTNTVVVNVNIPPANNEYRIIIKK